MTAQFYMKTSLAQARLIPLQVCTASLLLFLSPSLSAELRHFLSELCQEGMLTTPGIATLWEFTPLKVFFYHLLSSLCFFFSFSAFCVSPSCFFFLFLAPSLFFLICPSSHWHTHHVLPLSSPSLVSFCVGNNAAPAVWWTSRLVINKPDCFQNTTTFICSSFSLHYSYSYPWDMPYVLYGGLAWWTALVKQFYSHLNHWWVHNYPFKRI